MEQISSFLERENFHDYLEVSKERSAQVYVSGYCARRCEKFAGKCQSCINTLVKNETERTGDDLMITLKSKGYLKYPSEKLVNLIDVLEESVLRCTLEVQKEQNFIFRVVDRLEEVSVPYVGCEIHQAEVTKKVMSYYLIWRMHFIATSWTRGIEATKKKVGQYKKQAHLC